MLILIKCWRGEERRRRLTDKGRRKREREKMRKRVKESLKDNNDIKAATYCQHLRDSAAGTKKRGREREYESRREKEGQKERDSSSC